MHLAQREFGARPTVCLIAASWLPFDSFHAPPGGYRRPLHLRCSAVAYGPTRALGPVSDSCGVSLASDDGRRLARCCPHAEPFASCFRESGLQIGLGRAGSPATRPTFREGVATTDRTSRPRRGCCPSPIRPARHRVTLLVPAGYVVGQCSAAVLRHALRPRFLCSERYLDVKKSVRRGTCPPGTHAFDIWLPA